MPQFSYEAKRFEVKYLSIRLRVTQMLPHCGTSGKPHSIRDCPAEIVTSARGHFAELKNQLAVNPSVFTSSQRRTKARLNERRIHIHALDDR